MEKRIEELRTRLNKVSVKHLMSYEQISVETGLARRTITDFINGNSKPQYVILGKIEAYLDRKESE